VNEQSTRIFSQIYCLCRELNNGTSKIQVKHIPQVVLGGVMVILLANETKVRGFKSCRKQWIIKGNKNP
jgi:hypothetical protein